MPLQHVDARPRLDGSGIRFSMWNGVGDVRCYAYQGALDVAEQSMAEDMLNRFEQYQAMFETIASDLYDAGLPVRITADHVIKLRRR